MCGRFYVDDSTLDDIKRIVGQIQPDLQTGRKRDVFPSEKAAVIAGEKDVFSVKSMVWGFPHFEDKGLIINARSETVMGKRMFRDSIRKHRCVIPANGFYEWDQAKNKYQFTAREQTSVFMAGFYNIFDDRERFVILTTSANPSIADIHTRMPLLLKEEDVEDWIFDDRASTSFLASRPGPLNRHSDYVQQTLDL